MPTSQPPLKLGQFEKIKLSWGNELKVQIYIQRSCLLLGEVSISKNLFVKIWMKCTDQHRKLMFLNLQPHWSWAEVQFIKNIFTINFMTCPDQHRNVMFTNTLKPHRGWEQFAKKKLWGMNEIARSTHRIHKGRGRASIYRHF